MDSSIAEGRDYGMLGRRIRALRIAAGVSQSELARETGIDQPKLSRIEDGQRRIQAEELLAILQALGVDAMALSDPAAFEEAIDRLQRRQRELLVASFDGRYERQVAAVAV